MSNQVTDNLHVSAEHVLITPSQLAEQLPVSAEALEKIRTARGVISDIIHGKDHRLLVVCGPCSIHDVEAAKEYALKLKELHVIYFGVVSGTVQLQITVQKRRSEAYFKRA